MDGSRFDALAKAAAGTRSRRDLFRGLLAALGASVAQAGARAAAPSPPARHCPAPPAFSQTGVTVGLEATFAPGATVAFGLPLPPGAVTDARTMAVRANGQPVAATVTVLLRDYGADARSKGIHAVLVQVPAAVLHDGCGMVEVAWRGGGVTVGAAPPPFTERSAASNEAVETADYTIERRKGAATLVMTNRRAKTLFRAREPRVQATFPAGYLAATGILGPQMAAAELGRDQAGLRFISDAVTPFALSAMGQESYPLNAAFVADPTDPETGYEGWLYDRCATFLAFAAHTGDARFQREGYRLCSYYAGHIALSGERQGLFAGKAEPDPKYSHARGLYAYYALTGDETARAAGDAIAARFLADQDFVGPYRAGHIGNFWTERLLAVSLEALHYGHRLTGHAAYLAAARELVATAHRHITGDATVLGRLNPDGGGFPPQNCFIHNASQAGEGDADQPWCSGWMPALLVDPLLAYQAQTGDDRVEEILVRLTRYLRDVGSAYFTNTDTNADDTFLHPAVPSAAPDDEDQRLLVPLYGAGLGANGRRVNAGEFDDYEHCLDATAITAAGLRALKRQGSYDRHPIAPFASEGASFLALHQEFAFCAAWTFANDTRPHRDPATWTGPDAAAELATGLANPAKFIADSNIGNISHNVSPSRKISWWFNEALEQFALLRDARVAIPILHAGTIQPGRAVRGNRTQRASALPVEPVHRD